MSTKPTEGQKVVVPIGTDDVLATVSEIYGSVDDLRASVIVPLHGSTGALLGEETVSYPLGELTALTELDEDRLAELLHRYRPVAASISDGSPPPVWDWESYGEVRSELRRRGRTDREIEQLAWGP